MNTKNHINSCCIFNRLDCGEYISHTVNNIKNDSWSLDAFVSEDIANGRFEHPQMVCTKTLYNYSDFGLLDVKDTDLPIKLRRNTKSIRVKKYKKKLYTSIVKCLIDINNRIEFGHWEIDTFLVCLFKVNLYSLLE